MYDAYHKWLGIPKDQRPPTYYQLLGIAPDESDLEVVEEAALRQIAHIRTYQIGPHGAECTRILNEISLARNTLLNAAKRKDYDEKLAKKPQAIKTGAAPAKHDPFAELAPTDASAPATPKRTQAGVSVKKKGPPLGLLLGIGGGAAALLAIVLVIVLTRGGEDGKKGPGPIVKADDGKRDGLAKPVGGARKQDDDGGKKDEAGKKQGAQKDELPFDLNKDKVVKPPKTEDKKNPNVVIKDKGTVKANEPVVAKGDKLNPDAPIAGQPDRFWATKKGSVNRMAVSPDARLLATLAGTDLVVAKLENPDKIEASWLIANGTMPQWPLMWLDRQHLLFCQDSTGNVHVKEIFGQKPRPDDLLKGPEAPLGGLAVSKDGTRALAGYERGLLWLWDLTNSKVLREFEGHRSTVRATAFSRTGLAASTDDDGKLLLWDSGTWDVPKTLDVDKLTCLAYSADGKYLAGASEKKEIIVIDTAKQAEAKRLANTGDVKALVFAGSHLVTADGASIRVWDMERATPVFVGKGHDQPILSLAVSTDQDLVYSGGTDAKICLWSLKKMLRKE